MSLSKKSCGALGQINWLRTQCNVAGDHITLQNVGLLGAWDTLPEPPRETDVYIAASSRREAIHTKS